MTNAEILEDFPSLQNDDLLAVLAFAAIRERRMSREARVKLLFDQISAGNSVTHLAAEYPGSRHIEDLVERGSTDTGFGIAKPLGSFTALVAPLLWKLDSKRVGG